MKLFKSLLKRSFVAALFLFASTHIAVAETYRTPLTVETAEGQSHSFQVELALTDSQRARGLMYRKELEQEHGMLFIFKGEGRRSFWMRNTYIPLDIIYVRADGSIVNIIANATPLSEEPRPSTGPARAVLEIQGGLAEKLGIKPGDIVRHTLLGNANKQAN